MLLWMPDQVRNDVTMRCIVFALTFDSSPIKGEGDMVGVGLSFAPPCGYCLEASMTVREICRLGTMRCIVFTLTLVLSHQGRGGIVGCFGLVHPRHMPPHLSVLQTKSTMRDAGDFCDGC